MAENWAVEYQRPDGWWFAGDGWETREAAEQSAADQLPVRTRWRVLPASESERRGADEEED